MWFPHGDCYVHLYGRGQSARGPSFRVPFDVLVESGCRPLLERFLVWEGTPPSTSSHDDSEYFNRSRSSARYELYIPAPASAERGQSMLYHVATRNFFAWLFGRSLVGPHLGGALVGLLNSMNEFRNEDVENEIDILDYMDEEGYADMRNHPDHALAVLHFAENFRFRNVWIDAFAHCAGMNELLPHSSEFEVRFVHDPTALIVLTRLKFISRVSRAMINRGRLEMDVRMNECSERLSVFLEDELSSTYLGLTPTARAHLDQFRSFLHSYYVAKLGYYPPSGPEHGDVAFPMSTLGEMRNEFEMLYEFLADESFTSSDPVPFPIQNGFCALQNIRAFDARRHYEPLPYPLPLLPEIHPQPAARHFTKRMSWRGIQPDKLQLDSRLVSLNSIAKATNRQKSELLECSLVRAYRIFEKDIAFSKADKKTLSATEARKVRWIMVYATLQTLRSATTIPEEVRDFENVKYNLCVLTAGCPPWKEDKPYKTFLRTQTQQMNVDWQTTTLYAESVSPVSSIAEEEEQHRFSILEPDIDHRPVPSRSSSAGVRSLTSAPPSRKGTIRRALSTLGNMPELRHPKPVRNSFHEILVQGYGNGLNPVSVITNGLPTEEKVTSPVSNTNTDKEQNYLSIVSATSEDTVSSRWSKTDSETASSRPSSTSGSRRGSESSLGKEIQDLLEDTHLQRTTTGASSVYEDDFQMQLQPKPLLPRKYITDGVMPPDTMLVTTEVSVSYEQLEMLSRQPTVNAELYEYLSS